MKHILIFIVFTIIISFGIELQSSAQSWYNSNWLYRKAITVNPGQVPSTQINFPLLVNLPSDAGLSAHARSDGFDILFTTSDGITKIPYDREQYTSATGALVAWVNVPSVSVGTIIYMYYGNSGATDQQQVTSVWDPNYVGVYHVDEPGAGTTGEYKDATSVANNGTVYDLNLLQTAFSHSQTGGNDFRYQELTAPGDYTIVAGDVLVYDVYWTSASDLIAIDFQTSGGIPNPDALRNYAANDQNGVVCHPGADLSAYALNKWYHRVIPIPAGLVGKMITNYDIACEYDGSGTKTAFFSNIYIINNGNIKVNIYSPGGLITNVSHFSNPAAYTVSFSNVANPSLTGRSVTGEFVNALNANATRYIGMGAAATAQVNNWTLEAWINPGLLNQLGMFVYNGNDAGGFGFGMGNGAGSSGNKLQGLFGYVAWIDAGYTFPSTNTWYHVVMDRSTAGTTNFFVNGTVTSGSSGSTPNAIQNHLTVGNELDAANNPSRDFYGAIDEVRISKTARSADWIKTEYNNQSLPSTFYTVSGEESYTITTGTVSGSPFCAGATVSVPFTIATTFNTGNVFTAQLSNSSGSFSSPVFLGTLTSTTSGTISGTIPANTATGTGYRIRVVSSDPAITGTDNLSNLTINAVTIIVSQSTATQTQCINGTFTPITVTATGVGLTYQWYSNTTASTSGGSLISGATNSNYTPSAVTTGTLYYYCIVTGTCGTVTSTISGAFVVNPATAISSQSTAGQTQCLNGTFTPITVTATGTGTLTYQWYSNTTASTTGGTSLGSANGARTSSYTPQASLVGTLYYYCIVHSDCGSDITSAVSGAFIVNPRPIVSTSLPNLTYCSGSLGPAITFTSTPPGATFTWTSTADVGFGTSGSGTIPDYSAANGTSAPITATVSVTATANGCSGSPSTFTITVNPTPKPTISANYCAVQGQIQLTANPATGVTYLWSTTQTVNPISVNVAGMYSVTVKNAYNCSASALLSVATELITNGNFEAGNTGFTTTYNYSPGQYTGGNTGLWLEKTYTINNDPQYSHPTFWGRDHTTNSGKFMIVNGYGAATVWQYPSITVLPNTDYYFSAWAISLNSISPYANLQFKVNGVQVGTTTGPLPPRPQNNNPPYNWIQFYGSWNSGPATTATISIVDLEAALGGNDFGLDDISFWDTGCDSSCHFSFSQ